MPQNIYQKKAKKVLQITNRFMKKLETIKRKKIKLYNKLVKTQ